MPSNHKAIRGITCGMVWLWILFSFPVSSLAQQDGATPPALRVGVTEAPPLCMKTAANRRVGFSIELWQALAQSINVPFEFREFGSLQLLLDAMENGELDVIPSIAVREALVSSMDFSQSYLKSGLSIAVPVEDAEVSWLHVAESLFSPHALKAVAMLILLSLIAGILVWLFERRRNREMFGEGRAGGIDQGIWWAMVTMTTVGYGDKAPKTLVGRIVALIWMIFSIVFIASFTANITTSLTLSEMKGKVRGFNDLYHARVGSIAGSGGFDFLVKQGVTVIPIENFQEGLQAVAEKRIDAFVTDRTILGHLIKTEFPGRVQLLPGTYDEYFVSMALMPGSPQRKAINKALLQFMQTKDWTELLNRYLN